MTRIMFDYGHGGKDPGAVYKGRRESGDVLRVGMKTAKIMRSHGVIVDETRTTDKAVPLLFRSTLSNRKQYDYFVSFHRNAFNRKANGVETFSHAQSSSKSKALSKRMNNELVKIGFVDRGAKHKNLSVLRNTKAPAVLTELGFIDSVKDNKLFDGNIDKIAEAIARSILAELGIKYKGSDKVINTNLRYGSRGSKVFQLQKNLKILNYNITVGGAYGKETEKAVSTFQSHNKGVRRSGEADETTLRMISNYINNIERYTKNK